MDLNNIEFKGAYGTSAQIPASKLPEVSFVGRSNVGKSSLINKLLNRKQLARISQMPGKTSTINFETKRSISLTCRDTAMRKRRNRNSGVGQR